MRDKINSFRVEEKKRMVFWGSKGFVFLFNGCKESGQKKKKPKGSAKMRKKKHSQLEEAKGTLCFKEKGSEEHRGYIHEKRLFGIRGGG